MWKNASFGLSIAAIIALIISINTTNQRLLKLEGSRSSEEIDLSASDFENIAAIPGPVVSFGLPNKITFAGDSVPLKIQDVKERLDKELHINTYLHGSTIFLMKRANRWLPQIDSILKKEGIP